MILIVALEPVKKLRRSWNPIDSRNLCLLTQAMAEHCFLVGPGL